MGFFDKLFDNKKKTKIEKQAEERVKQDPSYSQANVDNIPTCNGCGGDITGKPRLHKYGGRLMYFHKRCFKALQRGQLPKKLNKQED